MTFKFPKLMALLCALVVPGCAELYLDAARKNDVHLKNKRLNNYAEMRAIAQCPKDPNNCKIEGAIRLAFHQADAFARAARTTQGTQDVLSLGLIRAAGLVVSGAASGATDTVLAKRAVDAVTVQQVGMRGTPKSAVEALYTGASRMNCIAMAGSLYLEVDLANTENAGQTTGVPVRLASFTMVLAMREVEYRTLHGTSRELADFSNLVQLFNTTVTEARKTDVIVEEQEGQTSEAGTFRKSGDQPAIRTRTITVLQQNPALERFFAVVKGCLEDAMISPNTAAAEAG